MSHHIYTTDGFILGSTPYGESGKFLLIFTHDLGLVSSTAGGVRVGSSKLRYHMQDYNFATFSLVRGKDLWRITGAKEKDNPGVFSKEGKIIYIKILTLLKRLLHGEEKNERLFLIIESLHKYICSREFNTDKSLNIESLTVFRILNNLGYIKSNNTLHQLLENQDINDELIIIVNKNRNEIINKINNALKESQM